VVGMGKCDCPFVKRKEVNTSAVSNVRMRASCRLKLPKILYIPKMLGVYTDGNGQ
jgi:hypothetical protein